jgi:Protein of unknown function (DUF2997)
VSQPRIIVRVAADGATQIKAQGFQGNSCSAATVELERALGIAQQRELTQEFYQRAQSPTQISAGH